MGRTVHFWKPAGTNTAEDRRTEGRQRIIGDILWSYAADKGEIYSKGTITDESESGLCILTLAAIEAGSKLKIYGEGRAAVRDATVLWCRKGSADIYKSGLSIDK